MIPGAEDLQGTPFKPPVHVTASHVYSNAYRKAQVDFPGDKARAKEVGQRASKLFRESGMVWPDLCGKFNSAPRKRPAATPQAGEGRAGPGVAAQGDAPSTLEPTPTA